MGVTLRHHPHQRPRDGRVRRGRVVSGHIRGETNTVPLLVEIFYNEYNFTGAFALSGVLALLALATLAVQNIITKLQDKKLAAAERNAV